MVTLPSEAADDDDLVALLAAQGMDVARINCAHDDATQWARMIDHVHAVNRTAGHHCLVAMDLAGPKLRTGPLEPGPRVIRVAPRRDRLGRSIDPGRVRLADPGRSLLDDRASLRAVSAVPRSASSTVDSPVVLIPVEDNDWLQRRRRGDTIEVVDSRGARRRWTVIGVDDGGCLATVPETTYVSTGLRLTSRDNALIDTVRVGELPEVAQAHRVGVGDRVILTRSFTPATPTALGTDHVVGCSLPEAFASAKPGERVWLDDGKIGGIIDYVDTDRIELIVSDVGPRGANLKAGKGINLPDTDLRLDALTAQDLDDLGFVARHADLVNLSFVRRPADVAELQSELERLGATDIGIVLKIENTAAFEHLPELLLVAMRSAKVGVMIARGDLAVEVGFERLAEVQEEIMWICEAAHVPVIWATQVLDTLARTGQASRAEITDAAMAVRAECVMLNKGPHIIDAIAALDSILARMQQHQDKKRSLLAPAAGLGPRHLPHVAVEFVADVVACAAPGLGLRVRAQECASVTRPAGRRARHSSVVREQAAAPRRRCGRPVGEGERSGRHRQSGLIDGPCRSLLRFFSDASPVVQPRFDRWPDAPVPGRTGPGTGRWFGAVRRVRCEPSARCRRGAGRACRSAGSHRAARGSGERRR